MPLKTQLNRANRRRRIRAVLLVVPLFIFILISFLIPIGDMLFRSVDNPVVAGLHPETLAELHKWDGIGVGENITLYTQESFALVAKEIGIEYETYREDEDDDEMLFYRCRKKV